MHISAHVCALCPEDESDYACCTTSFHIMTDELCMSPQIYTAEAKNVFSQARLKAKLALKVADILRIQRNVNNHRLFGGVCGVMLQAAMKPDISRLQGFGFESAKTSSHIAAPCYALITWHAVMLGYYYNY